MDIMCNDCVSNETLGVYLYSNEMYTVSKCNEYNKYDINIFFF